MTTFASRLTELRKKAGKKRQEVADDLGISRASLEYYEKDKRKPDIEILLRIANYFNVSCDYLIRGVNSEFSEINSTTGLMEEAINELAIEKRMVEFNNDTFPNHLDILNKFIQNGVILDIALQITKYKECLEQKKGLYDMAVKSYKEPNIDCEIFDDKGFDGRLNEIQDKIDLYLFKLQRLMICFAEEYCSEYIEEIKTAKGELNKCEMSFIKKHSTFFQDLKKSDENILKVVTDNGEHN